MRSLEIVVLAAAVLPFARLFRIEGFIGGFGRFAALLAAGIAGYLAIVAAVAVWLPAALHVLAALALAGMAAGYWFSRPGYGSSRGLPPGSLSLLASLEAIFDHRFHLKQASRHGPVFKMLQFHKPVVCVVGLERGHELIRLPDDVLSPAPQPFSAEIPGGFLRYMTPEMHGAYAPKLRAAFSWTVVAAAEPAIRQAIRVELQSMAGDSRLDTGVRPAPYLQRAMFVSFARLVFGFAPGSEDLERFRSTWSALETQNLALSLAPTTRTALADLRTLALQQIERLDRDAGPECVLGEWLRSVPGTPDRTVLDNLMFLFTIGVENVSSLLRWVLKMLADHPRLGERVRAEGAPLAERIVMETLRLEQSEYIYRLVRSPLAIGDYQIPAGWRFRLCVRESHRDPTLFENPEAFDPDRFLQQRSTHAAYSPFGAGRHACLAPHASHVAARMLVEELAEGYDWKITADGPRQRLPRHWHHWEPSSRFAVALSPRR